jgi:hypothetical protein
MASSRCAVRGRPFPVVEPARQSHPPALGHVVGHGLGLGAVGHDLDVDQRGVSLHIPQRHAGVEGGVMKLWRRLWGTRSVMPAGRTRRSTTRSVA